MSESSRGPVYVERMSILFRIQHLLLMISLLVLALTGFALMYHENWLAQALVRLEGGMLYRGIIHRAAAVFLMAQLVYHAFYMLISREGKRELKEIWLTRRDFDDFLQAMRFNLGMDSEYPRFGKYGYKEKFQYWGATAGVFLISVTGGILWAELRGCVDSKSLVQNYILGLGGGDIRPEHIDEILEDLLGRERAEAPMIKEVGT